jgi:hypothetical protein
MQSSECGRVIHSRIPYNSGISLGQVRLVEGSRISPETCCHPPICDGYETGNPTSRMDP